MSNAATQIVNLDHVPPGGAAISFMCKCGGSGIRTVAARANGVGADRVVDRARVLEAARLDALELCRCDPDAEPPPPAVDSWALTSSGRAFDFAAPAPESIALADVARGLALECRFANQTAGVEPVHYSVAQHSILIAKHAHGIGGARLALDGLLHDAAEAYLGDWPRPLKRLLGAPLKEIEHRIEVAVVEGLGVADHVVPGGSPAIKALDVRALATERRDLMTGAGEHGERPWIATERVEPFEDRIVPLSAAVAERSWLECFRLFVDQVEELDDEPDKLAEGASS